MCTLNCERTCGLLAILSLLVSSTANGADFDINWYTIDGGGGTMTSQDGVFSLSGTIGQPDAGVMASQDGVFTIVGGFWGVAASVCGGIASSDPANCAVDARQNSNLNGSNPDGWDFVSLTFNPPSCVPIAESGDFSVSQSAPGTPPGVADASVNGGAVDVELDAAINPGVWTCVTHIPSGFERCFGFLPGDADGDGLGEAADVTRLSDHLSSIGPLLPIHQCDMDRSNLCGARDVVRAGDLLNGAETYIPRLAASLGACPTGP